MDDPARLRHSVRKLLDLQFNTLLVGDGTRERTGLVDRLRSLPMYEPALLVGELAQPQRLRVVDENGEIMKSWLTRISAAVTATTSGSSRARNSTTGTRSAVHFVRGTLAKCLAQRGSQAAKSTGVKARSSEISCCAASRTGMSGMHHP